MIKSTNILKARAGGRQEFEGSDQDKAVESVMIAATPPSRGVKSLKRKREVEGLSSPSTDAVSEKNLRETAPMVLARWKTAAYKGNSEPRKFAEVEKEMKVSTSLATEEDVRPQKTNTKRGSTSGQMWELDQKARSWSVPQASQLDYQTKGRDQQVRTGEPTETNLAALTTGFF